MREEKQIPLEELLSTWERWRRSVSSESDIDILEELCKIIFAREDCDEKIKEKCLQDIEEARAQISNRRLELEECIKSINREMEKDPEWEEYLNHMKDREEHRAMAWINSRRKVQWDDDISWELEDAFERESKSRLELVEDIKSMNREEEKDPKRIDNIRREQENKRRLWREEMSFDRLIDLRDSLKREIDAFEYNKYDLDFLERECFMGHPSVEYKYKCENFIEVCEIILTREDRSEVLKAECRRDIKDGRIKIKEGLYSDIEKYFEALKLKVTLTELLQLKKPEGN